MQCPFLKKISFKKVTQIACDDFSCEELPDSSQLSTFTEDDFNFCDDKIEIINSSDVNKHNVYYFNSKINIPERSNNHLEIKYPKQLQIKKMINANELMEIEEREETCESIISESDLSESRNVPHVLVSKMSMLASKCENIFQGDIILSNEKNNVYQCEIQNHNIRISQGDKIKYFIELKNASCSLENVRDNCALLVANCKSNSLSLNIQFKSKNKIYSFVKALELNYLEIDQENQKENLVDEGLGLSYSMDSLGFEVERMDIHQLKQVGDTFDILLFKNKTMMSKFQRIFTNSDYDHVAMLLKTSSNEMFILESSSNAGVAVYTLNSLINLPRKKYYFRVGLRQYKGQRKFGQIAQLQQFIRRTMGKKYKFDPMYLISSDVKKEDTYFCSELISAALQHVGILNKSKPAYKYLPKHFAQQQLKQSMLKGSYSQIIIVQ